MNQNLSDIPVVILCGGRGTRLQEETATRPKPLVEIGGMPILWHIMKWYARFGSRRFVLCLGYKGDMIKDYFLEYQWRKNNFRLDLVSGNKTPLDGVADTAVEDWEIDFIDTGDDTNTGGRVYKIRDYVDGERFFLTYGDGVADVNIGDLYRFHLDKGKIATLTGLHPWSKYGQVVVDEDQVVKNFIEKPKLKDLINGGFFIFEAGVFDYLDDDCVLEERPLERLAEDRQIALYKHEGFWHAMDTYKDFVALNEMWEAGNSPWKCW
ncbi:MAG: sugar phosphate nucleotidyltransferase [Actinomycetota bacterium]|nr:sugar phosphate nucleotidyltransferase [Actinomycetota bacterium]